jgi:hypothetical protein
MEWARPDPASRAMAIAANKIVLHARVPYAAAHAPLLRELLARNIALFCAVGVDCRAWEDAMDWTCIGPDGESLGFVVTTSHPTESLEAVIAFAEAWVGDEPGGVEVVEV